MTETLGAAALQKARHEIAAFRAFQQHVPALVEVNAAICRLRPISAQESELSKREKKRRKRSKKRSAAK